MCTHICMYVHAYKSDITSPLFISFTLCHVAFLVVTRLKGFSSAYELVKSEKNKIVTLIQQASQVTLLVMPAAS